MCLALLASSVLQFIRLNRAFPLAVHFIGQGDITQPPAPAIAGTDMATHFSGNAPRRAGELQQKRRQNPVRQRPLTPVQEGLGEVVERAPTTMAPVALASRAVLVRAPAANGWLWERGHCRRWSFHRSVWMQAWHCLALKRWCKCDKSGMAEHLLVS